MKKKLMLTMAIVMLLGSVKAMATTSEPRIITTTSLQVQINELWTLQDQLQDIEDSGHLLSDLGQTYDLAVIQAHALDKHFDRKKAEQLDRELSEVITAAKVQIAKLQ
ncbi:MAG: hypothetical protein ACM3MG_10715 [Bacillota bacterium]